MIHCPSCGAFISLKTFYNLISEFVWCRACGSHIHVSTVFPEIAFNHLFALFGGL